MIKPFLFLLVVLLGLSTSIVSMYASALDVQISVLEERLKVTAISLAFYRYEHKHSVSGTRRHVGEALGNMVLQKGIVFYEAKV